MVDRLIRRGVKAVFLDPLRLGDHQLAVTTDRELPRLCESAWTDEAIDQISQARDVAIEAEISWECNNHQAWTYECEGFRPYHWLEPFNRFGYHRHEILTHSAPPKTRVLSWSNGTRPSRSWKTRTMIDQPFRWSQVRGTVQIFQDTPLVWERRLKPAAPIREFLHTSGIACDQGFYVGEPVHTGGYASGRGTVAIGQRGYRSFVSIPTLAEIQQDKVLKPCRMPLF